MSTESLPTAAPTAVAWRAPLQSVAGIGTAATAAMMLAVTLSIAGTAQAWMGYSFVSDAESGEPVTLAQANRIDLFGTVAAVGWRVALLVAAILVIVWLWRTRSNAEQLSPAPHRRHRGWIIGGWICPIVNLWFPKQIVDDVWRASDPAMPPVRLNIDAMPRPGLGYAWWTCLLAWQVIDRILSRMYRDDTPSLDQLRLAARLETASTALCLLSGLALGLIIHRVSGWQTRGQPG